MNPLKTYGIFSILLGIVNLDVLLFDAEGKIVLII